MYKQLASSLVLEYMVNHDSLPLGGSGWGYFWLYLRFALKKSASLSHGIRFLASPLPFSSL